MLKSMLHMKVHDLVSNTDVMNARGTQHFRDWLNTAISPWPLISTQQPDDLDLTNITINIAKYGWLTLVTLYPSPDNKDSNRNILQVISYTVTGKRNFTPL